MADNIVAQARQLLRRAVLRLRLRPRALLLTADGVWDPAGGGMAHRDFSAWCSAHPGLACELWVGALALADVVGEDPDTGPALRSDSARTAWARRVLHHYHGTAAALWPMLPWQARGAWGASALRGISLDELQAQARPHGVVLRAVRPLWPRLLDKLLAQQPGLRRERHGQAWLVEAHGDVAMLTRVGLSQGRITSVQRRRLQAPWAPAMQRLLDEETQAGTGRETRPVLLWLGSPPQVALPLQLDLSLGPPYREVLLVGAGRGPDFLRPTPQPGLLSWAWLGTCVAALVLAAGDAHEAWTARVQAHVQPLAVPAEPLQRASAPAVDPVLLALMQRLHHPWRAVFLASETPALAGLRWVALDHRAGAEVRLQGVASDAAQVQQVAAALRQMPAWPQVLVARLEAQPQGPALAFEIVAQLREAAP